MNLVNEALKHYRNLRNVAADPAQERLELLEIIRLCQLEIQKHRGSGDAHVLLANALSVAATNAGSLYHNALAHGYLLSRASAVIYHASQGGVWTRNKEIGKWLLATISEELAADRHLSPTQIEPELKRLHDLFYRQAVDPASLPTIQSMVQGEQ